MMNSRINPISTGTRRSRTPGRSPTGLATTALLAAFIASASAYLFIANILGKIGLGQIWLHGMVLLIPAAVFIFAGYSMRISGAAGLRGFEDFKRAGGSLGAAVNAMSAAAEWLSLFFIVGLTAALSETNHDGIAIVIGAYCGFTFVAVFVLPKLQRQDLVSLPAAILSMIHGRKTEKTMLRVTIAAVVILSAMIFFVSQIALASRIFTLHFPIPIQFAAMILLAPVIYALLAGGMRALSVANILLIWVIGAALLLPAIWLSADITGNPIPQLGYGDGALQPIQQLETQLLQNNAGLETKGFEQGNFTNLTGIADFLATVLSIMAATMAMPLLYSRMACSTGVAMRARSIGWTMVIVALLASTLPAFVILMKFEVYRNFVGLPINQIGDGILWVMDWAKFEAGDHAMICGGAAVDLQAIITSCGNDPGHVLLPSDLQFSTLMMLMGAGELSNMPSVFSAITFAGLLSAAATTAGIAMMLVVNTASAELIFLRHPDPVKGATIAISTPNSAPISAPIARRLFVSRLLLILLAAVGIWFADKQLVLASDISLWVFALAAGAIFPVLILALAWKPMTALGGLIGIIAALAGIIFIGVSIEFGSDWIVRNGNEPIWLMPFSGEPLRAVNLAIVVIPFAIAITMSVSIIQRFVRFRLRKRGP